MRSLVDSQLSSEKEMCPSQVSVSSPLKYCWTPSNWNMMYFITPMQGGNNNTWGSKLRGILLSTQPQDLAMSHLIFASRGLALMRQAITNPLFI